MSSAPNWGVSMRRIGASGSRSSGGKPGTSGLSPAARISHAAELIAALRGLGPEEARRDLRAAARRTGTTELEVARTVIVFHG
jgi:hypothetical protein